MFSKLAKLAKKIKKIKKVKKIKRPMRNIKVKNYAKRNYRKGGKV
tara:strand:+ start:996 stop:1130 length:135 start_codon:yes stop_codon:yes gene_type:complete